MSFSIRPYRRLLLAHLVRLVGSLSVVLFLLGCGIPIHQQRAAEALGKGTMALADYWETEMPMLLNGTMALLITKKALLPTEGDKAPLDDREYTRIQKVYTFYAELLRASANVTVAAMKRDESSFKDAIRKGESARKRASGVIDGKSPPFVPLTDAQIDAGDFKKISPEAFAELEKILVRQLRERPVEMKAVLSESLPKQLAIYQMLIEEVRAGSHKLLSDPAVHPLIRLSAAQQYRATIELPLNLEIWRRRNELILSQYEETCNKAAAAIEAHGYTLEDAKAVIEEVDKMMKNIEQATAIIKRMIGFLLLIP